MKGVARMSKNRDDLQLKYFADDRIDEQRHPNLRRGSTCTKLEPEPSLSPV